MQVIPAIDLRFGRAVRLKQGDYEKEKFYSNDVVALAKMFEAAGAPRIHIVDLDGALAGKPTQFDIYRRIADSVSIPVQVGGGIRSMEALDKVFGAGIDRVVLGTVSVNKQQLVKDALAQYGANKIIIGLDVRHGMINVQGWTESTSVRVNDLIAVMIELGVGRFVFTDILRDGTLTEPNFESVLNIVEQMQKVASTARNKETPMLIVSGGIGKIEHLVRLKQMMVEGVIVGSAIYEGTIDLREAVVSVG